MKAKFSIGDIKFEVPVSWIVAEVDGMIEIVETRRKGAMHISILSKIATAPPTEADALALVANFASNNGLVRVGADSLTTDAQRVVAMGSYRPSVPLGNLPSHWLLAGIVWKDKAAQISYCTDFLTSESLVSVSQIINTIERSN